MIRGIIFPIAFNTPILLQQGEAAAKEASNPPGSIKKPVQAEAAALELQAATKKRQKLAEELRAVEKQVIMGLDILCPSF